MSADAVRSVLRQMASDAAENRQAWGDEDAELQSVEDANALSYVDQLIETTQRTVAAFEALGKASGVIDTHRARLLCEASMQAQTTALAAWPAPAASVDGGAA